MGNVQATLGHSLCSKSLCTLTGCLVGKMVPREGPASLEPGQRPPQLPQSQQGFMTQKPATDVGVFQKHVSGK